MNTNTLGSTSEWSWKGIPVSTFSSLTLRHAAAPVLHARPLAFPLLLSILPALAIVVAAAWAVNAFETPRILQALAWSAGFVFLALAMESTRPSVIALLATGLALPVLALLSSWVAPEFVIVAAALVAIWTAVAIFRFLCGLLTFQGNRCGQIASR